MNDFGISRAVDVNGEVYHKFKMFMFKCANSWTFRLEGHHIYTVVKEVILVQWYYSFTIGPKCVEKREVPYLSG